MADQLTELKYNEDVEFVFCDTFGMNEMKCLEIEPELIDDLKAGKLEIRGDGDDETVLVSACKSYKIRQHDSSNTILLTSFHHKDHQSRSQSEESHPASSPSEPADPLNMDNNEEIYSAISCLYVLSEQPPRLNKLHQVLYQRPYKGIPTPEPSPGDSQQNSPRPPRQENIDLSFEGLKLLVQCSDKELMDGLEAINALQIGNEWRIVDESYLFSCFHDLLLCIMEHNIDIKHFRTEDIQQNRDEFPLEITTHCIKINAVAREPDVNGYWKLDETKLCVFCAKQILSKQPGHKMKDSEFQRLWREQLPYGIEPDTAMLLGHVIGIYEKKMGQNMWYIFEEKKLSLDPKERFKELFARRDEWSMEQIVPYMESLVNAGLKVDKLLLRHTRMVRTKGADGQEKRIYISRSARR